MPVKRPVHRAAEFQPTPQGADAIYTGRFEIDAVKAVLDAAGQISAEPFVWTGPEGQQLSCSRSEAIIRRLESLDFDLTAAANDLSPSALEKKLHAIAAATSTLSDLLLHHASDDSASLPAQVENALWAMAAEDGEPDPDSRLREIIDAITQLRRWSQKGERRARGRPELKEEKDDHSSHIRLYKRQKSCMDASTVNDPIDRAIVAVLSIWADILRREIKTPPVRNVRHDDYGIAYGDLVNFTLACIRLLNLDPDRRLGEDAIRGRIRRKIEARRTVSDFENRRTASPRRSL